MNNPITAIYENGILRPIAPLDLPDQVQVQIVIQPFDEPKVESSSDRPKPTMAELWADLDKINRLEPDLNQPYSPIFQFNQPIIKTWTSLAYLI